MTFLNWLKKVFGTPVAPAPIVVPPAVFRRTRIAIVVGHNSKARGAVRVTDGLTEFQWNSVLAEMIANKSPGNYRVFYRQAGNSYVKEVRDVYAEVDDWNADASIELHFNANANPSATGTETLSSGSFGSMYLARLMQREMVDALGIRDRGIKVLKQGDRGGESVFAGKAPAVLLEPYFGSNLRDCAIADQRLAALVEGIHQACMAYKKD
jgi:N-acetylmuramoyl-L-alanine amidase